MCLKIFQFHKNTEIFYFFCGSHGINLHAYTSACRSNIAYIWISLDHTKGEPTLGVGRGVGAVVVKGGGNLISEKGKHVQRMAKMIFYHLSLPETDKMA